MSNVINSLLLLLLLHLAVLSAGDVPEAWGFMTAPKYKLRCLNLAGAV
jgi:hypothetical protein